jgi:hypothetical protein
LDARFVFYGLFECVGGSSGESKGGSGIPDWEGIVMNLFECRSIIDGFVEWKVWIYNQAINQNNKLTIHPS